ncbi:MAG: hypothetical protein ABWZ87_02785 [Aeromicrobium sp.]
MSVQLAMLVATAVLAVVAVIAAAVALVAVRRLRALHSAAPPAPAAPPATFVTPVGPEAGLEPNSVTHVERGELEPRDELDPRGEPTAEVVRVVEGRVIVQPTHDQIVAATMTRPAVRLSILAGGIAHALRPESRDRILALMRREYRARKRARQRAARAAARATNDPPPPSGGRGWVGS